MAAVVSEQVAQELIDIIDLQPIPGEYVHCAGRPMEPFDVFGVTVDGWFRCHAQRRAVGQRWEGKCECCGARLRYAHVTRDGSGEYHCYGGTCLNVVGLGEAGARRLEYSQRITHKDGKGFVATFSVPPKLWDLPRDDRPVFARLWKGEERSRRGARTGRVQWKLSVWGDSFEECLDHCMGLSDLLGVKLS
jgi:hypothetical protein